jgi:U6 snRNA-associated Sm-like protein LSm7
MSERGAFRGGRGGGRGGDRGGRGGGRGGAQGGGGAGQTERPKKENILDLSKYMDKQLTVKFSGGREGEWRIGVRRRSSADIWQSLARSRATTSS